MFSGDGEAKYWLQPTILLASFYGLKRSDLTIIKAIIKEHEDEIRTAWSRHFGT